MYMQDPGARLHSYGTQLGNKHLRCALALCYWIAPGTCQGPIVNLLSMWPLTFFNPESPRMLPTTPDFFRNPADLFEKTCLHCCWCLTYKSHSFLQNLQKPPKSFRSLSFSLHPYHTLPHPIQRILSSLPPLPTHLSPSLRSATNPTPILVSASTASSHHLRTSPRPTVPDIINPHLPPRPSSSHNAPRTKEPRSDSHKPRS